MRAGLWARIAGTIGDTVLLLTVWTAILFYGWFSADVWQDAAWTTAGFNMFSLLVLFCMQRFSWAIPGKLFWIRFIAAVFVGEFLFDGMGSLFGLGSWSGRLLLGRALPDAFALILLIGTMGLGFYSVFIEPRLLDSNHFEIPVPGLDATLAGFTIAQLSDVHLGPFVSVHSLQRLLDKAVQQHPEVLVITGDLFDSPEPLVNNAAARLLDSYAEQFPAGIYYVWGNHEYYHDVEAIRRSLEAVRIHVLRNDCRQVRDGRPPLYFAGVDYPVSQGVTRIHAPHFVREACAAVPPGATLIMLAHHPDFFDDAAKAGAVLTLSGHTHGGQMGLFGHTLMPPLFRYWRGMYERDGHYLYVHKGSGGRFPYRLGCMPEIAYFTLRRK